MLLVMTQPHRPVGPGDHVFLVDGSSFVFRAYYQSIRQDQKYNYRSDRLPTGAVRLFATKVLQFIREGAAGFKPTHLAIIFDKTENSFRRDIYPLYKAHRKDPPDELLPQFPLMRATVSAFGMVPIEQGRDEADDLIAYLRPPGAPSRRRRADRLGRKDLMQLVEPCVTMYDPASGQAGVAGSREERRFGRRGVVNISGVGADKVVDVQALAGDFDRQCARRARHRAQDRRAAHRRIWRSRDAARPRGRNQAAQAARSADRSRNRQAHPDLEAARHFGSRRAGGDAARGAATPQLDGKRLSPSSRRWS